MASFQEDSKRPDRFSGRIPVVCIGGPSAVGKTSFTIQLAEALSAIDIQVLVICCDDYYRKNWRPHSRFGFDTMDAIDIDALRSDLERVKQRSADSLRTYDMRTRAVARKALNQSYELVLLEGAYGPQDLLEAGLINVFFYLDLPLWLRLVRRLRRDVQDRGRNPLQIIQQMLMQMIPGERAFIRPLRSASLLVITDLSQGKVSAIKVIQSLMTQRSPM